MFEVNKTNHVLSFVAKLHFKSVVSVNLYLLCLNLVQRSTLDSGTLILLNGRFSSSPYLGKTSKIISC